MYVLDDYCEYIAKVENGESRYIYSSEVSVLKVITAECNNMPLSKFYLWDNLNDKGQTFLLKVEYNGDSLRIVEGCCIERTLVNVAKSIDVDNLEKAMKWWNLCYHRDNQGNVRYDSYYDNFYAANVTGKKMSELKETIAQWSENSFMEVDGLVYVLGELANCNPIIYQLQQRGLKVKTLPIDNPESESEANERMLQLREQLALPYCDSNLINVSSFTLDGVDNCPVKCHHSYLITIPIDLIDIEDKAIGDFTYKDILSNGKFCRDYSCCGHDYSYVEMEFFADLHGNTVLKTTNSEAESKYTIINRFNYTNLQKDGQTN